MSLCDYLAVADRALLGALTVNTASAKETISVVGSNSASLLVEVFAETYMNKGEPVFIEIQAPGSSAGIKAAKNGSADPVSLLVT